MSEEEKKDPGFRVSDRRRFSVSNDGEARDAGGGEEEKRKAPEAGEAGPAGGKPDRAGKPETGSPRAGAQKQREPTPLPEINFSTFVVSLSSSALIHLGIVPDPMSGETSKDLPLAKQTIDMLAMLQEKTRGNLTEDEAKLMEGMLYDLRMRYVAESK